MELIDLARRTAEEHGRDPGAIEITVSMPADPAELSALKAAGVGRVLVPVSPMAGLKTMIRSPEDVENFRDIIAEHG